MGMSDIEECHHCREPFCTSCVVNCNCKECGAETCGEQPCVAECILDDGCGELICKDCYDEHDCIEPDDEELE